MEQKYQRGSLLQQPAYFKAVNAPNIATDLVMLLLPFRTILGLQASIARKVGLLLVFLSGSVYVVFRYLVQRPWNADVLF
jgi:hypothetical protein